MGMTQRSTVKTYQDGKSTVFQPSSDEVLSDNAHSDDLALPTFPGVSPLSSSNQDRIDALNKARAKGSQSKLFEDGNETEISPSVAYIDLDGLFEDDELYLGSVPDGEEGETTAEYQDRVKRALREHVERTMDDGQDYNPKLDPSSPEYDPELAESEASQGGDTEFGDEVSEIDVAGEEDLKRLLEERGVKTAELGSGPEAVEKMRQLMRSKLLMDFDKSAESGAISHEDADALQEQFKNGTILVKDNKEDHLTEDDGTKSVVENYVIAGQLDNDGEAQTLSALDALDLARATLQNYEGIPEETSPDQVWDKYIKNEALQASKEGKSDLFEASDAQTVPEDAAEKAPGT